MVSGRLRERDRNEIAVRLMDWAKDPSSINLNKFCMIEEIVPSKISQWAKEDDLFRQAYEYAKACVGSHREEKLNAGELHTKAYDMNAPVYDFFLKEEKRLQAEFEARLKSDENQKVDAEHVQKTDAILNQLSSIQDKISSSK